MWQQQLLKDLQSQPEHLQISALYVLLSSNEPLDTCQHEASALSNPVLNILPPNSLGNAIPQTISITQPTFPSMALSSEMQLHNAVGNQNMDSLLQLPHTLVSSVSGVVLPSQTEKQ